MRNLTTSSAYFLAFTAFVLTFNPVSICLAAPNEGQIPNLVGTWTGENNTYSEKKGYSAWTKTVEISEQKGRIFKGKFTYSDGTKHFFGVIYPDNSSFTWVSPDSQGYNQGRILSKDNISACYVESGPEATVGCAELTRKSQ